jgi:hypothetical protein
MIPAEPAARLVSPDEGQSLSKFVRLGPGDVRLTTWAEHIGSDRDDLPGTDLGQERHHAGNAHSRI